MSPGGWGELPRANEPLRVRVHQCTRLFRILGLVGLGQRSRAVPDLIARCRFFYYKREFLELREVAVDPLEVGRFGRI